MKTIFALMLAMVVLMGCDPRQKDSDEQQRAQSERLLAEGTAQTGMPAIKNFRERKLLKDILELRDQSGLVTYTYLWNEFNGKKVFFCESIGYGIPYATQYTNPMKVTNGGSAPQTHIENVTIPQADPSGLFSPAAAEGTWVMCKDPNGKSVKPVYVEPRIIVSPFALNN